MSVALYMDVNAQAQITQGLRRRGVDCITAQEDGQDRTSDADLLDRSTALGRILFTNDSDFLREAAHRQRHGISFAGIVFARFPDVSIGQCVNDLELIAKVDEPQDWIDRLVHLPL